MEGMTPLPNHESASCVAAIPIQNLKLPVFRKYTPSSRLAIRQAITMRSTMLACSV
jgi:hypothetical protein